MEFLVFGDQTADQYSLLRELCRQQSNPILTAFLERSAAAIRVEAQRLGTKSRSAIPSFATVAQLVDAYCEKREKVPELESCLVNIAQLGHFFKRGSAATLRPEATRIVGICTGLLSASAVSSAGNNTTELLDLAVDIVRIAFRVGTCVGHLRDALDSGVDAVDSPSWATKVNGINYSDALDALAGFHDKNGIPPSSQAYVSAVSSVSLTIAGPPSTTKRLFQSSAFLPLVKVAIPVYAPYHASHLYEEADIDIILDGISQKLQKLRPVVPIHSASGKCYDAADSQELLRLILTDILQKPVRLDSIVKECRDHAKLCPEPSITVSAIGVTNLVHSLVSALKTTGKSISSLTDRSSRTSPLPESNHVSKDKIAIIGMAGRFPGAKNHDELWELLDKGLDMHRVVPNDRFDAHAHYDPTGNGRNKSHTLYGCFIDEPGLFDPRFFNMSPREAAQTDPMGRLALVTAYEALEMSGYVPNRTPSTRSDRIGTFYGQTSDDWREINAAEDVDTYFITGGVRAFGSGRINYYFKFSGPSYSVDTACSSSLAAIQLACLSLWSGECDTACAGGVNVLTNPDIFSGLSKGQFLSKTGSCKTYDDKADGYCRGDACGTVILKRYQDAIADKDNILACILSAGTNHSAEAVSITHPHAATQEALYKHVLAEAGLDAHDISYIEMHGTGTQAGDAIEMSSVTNVFAPSHRQRSTTLNLGAIKANIGHGEAASGFSGLVKVLMMMQKNSIPPNVGIKSGIINRTFPKDLERRKVNIPRERTPWPRMRGEKRKILVNNFSAAGGNTAIIVEDSPLRQLSTTATDPRKTHVITVSAKSIASLKRNIHKLASHVDDMLLKSDLSSLSYTTTARRIHHPYRVAFTIADIQGVSTALESQIKETYSPCSMVPTKVMFTFTGQGSQYSSLGKELYTDLPSFRSDIDLFDKLAVLQGFPSFLPLITGSAEIQSLSPVIVQLGISCVQIALARMWQSWGITPCGVIGHSLGEYAALHVAGVISASDMILLVGRRAQLFESHCTRNSHAMVAIKASVDSVRTSLGNKLDTTEIACVNGTQETVISGESAAVDAAHSSLVSQGFKATKLDVPYAFHSSQVDPILPDFEQVASAVEFHKPNLPILSPLTKKVIYDSGVIGPKYLCRHARETVDFHGALSAGHDVFTDKTAWVEIGPHPICLGMIQASLPGQRTSAPSLRRKENPWETIASSICKLYLAGAPLNFNEYHRSFNDAQELLLLPTYSFDEKKYWLDYHNNWTLTKGELPPLQIAAPEPVEEVTKSLSTSCQRIVKEEYNGPIGRIVVQSDFSEPKLHAVVSGHVVNDAPLCPSSLYGDMAMTVSNYLYEQLCPSATAPIGLNVCAMEVHKTLIAASSPPPEGQHLQLEATADIEQMSVKLQFRSVTASGQVVQELGNGLVKYEEMNGWLEEWARIQYLVKARIDYLTNGSSSSHKIYRGLAYKLFQALVTYAPKYRGMEEVTLDSTHAEATAIVRFQTTAADGDFFCSPYWIDSLAHLSGFILNGSDLVDSSQNVYISNGWSSIKISRPLSADKQYQSYVRMQDQANGSISAGDVYIFEDGEIIGVVAGLKFQRVSRKALNVMVPPVKKANAKLDTKLPPKPAAKPQYLQYAGKETTVTTQSSSHFDSHGPASTITKTTKLQTTRITDAPAVTVAVPKTNTDISLVMNIIAEETNIDISELVDDAMFDNLGVDSLLSLMILARLRETLEIDIPSGLFVDCPTIGQLKTFLSNSNGTPNSSGSTDSSSTIDSLGSSIVMVDPSGFPESPASSFPSLTPSSDHAGDLSSYSSRPGKEIKQEHNSTSVAELNLVRQIVANEIGMPVDELTDEVNLSQLGMDSLMSLVVLSSLREQLNVDLPIDSISQNWSMAELEHALGIRRGAEIVQTETHSSTELLDTKDYTSVSTVKTKHTRKISMKGVYQPPPATSVLLQGNAKTAKQKLFFLPDGSGSATSYISIPNIGPQVAIFGLNCPFMKTPLDFTCGVEGVCKLYLSEIRKRQPTGPYILGGWSAGGVIAYEAAVQLIALGEEVETLLLLDSPCPVGLEKLPIRLHHFFDQIGLLGTGTGKSPAWLLPHFQSSINALDAYRPQPIQKGKAPRTFAIWATDGVCGKPGDPRPAPSETGEDDPKPMKWLLDNRTDFSDNGWGQLLGVDNIECATMGGDHFSMMRPEHAQELGKLIRQGLRV